MLTIRRKEDLGMYGNELNYMQTCWTIGYVIGEIPSNLLLTRIKPRYWIPAMEVRFLFIPRMHSAYTFIASMDRPHNVTFSVQQPDSVLRSTILRRYVDLIRVLKETSVTMCDRSR
jgi:hypothetical protein